MTPKTEELSTPISDMVLAMLMKAESTGKKPWRMSMHPLTAFDLWQECCANNYVLGARMAWSLEEGYKFQGHLVAVDTTVPRDAVWLVSYEHVMQSNN